MSGNKMNYIRIAIILILTSLISTCSGPMTPETPPPAIATPQTANFDETTIRADKLFGLLEVFVGLGSVPNEQGETLEITAVGISRDYVIEFFKTAKFSFIVRDTLNPSSANVKPDQTVRFSVVDALNADERNLLIQFDIPVNLRDKYPKGSIDVVVDPYIGEKQQHIYLPTDPSTNQVDVEVSSLQGAVEGDLYLRDVGLLDTKQIIEPLIPQIISGAGDGIFDFVITGLGPGNSEYQFRGTWSYDTTEPVAPEPFEISQTEGEVSAWFGQGNEYVNVGEGQSFVVNNPVIIEEFSIYLEAVLSNADEDKIICDLRDADMVILQSSSVSGFDGGEGWTSFEFDITVNPGTYLFTCYLDNSNVLESHTYYIHGNSDDNSYIEGTRYTSRDGHPEDGSTWVQLPWDLKFIIKMKMLPLP